MATNASDLLGDVKNYLDITWNDEKTDSKLMGIISRGMRYIDDIVGVEQSYLEENKARELLFEYCLYARSNKLAEFETNYLHEILKFQIAVEVEEYGKTADIQ